MPKAQCPKLVLLATALPLALRSRWRSIALGVGDSLPSGDSIQNPNLSWQGSIADYPPILADWDKIKSAMRTI